MKKHLFGLLLLSFFAFYNICFCQEQGDIWERNPGYEVLEDGSIYIGTVPINENTDNDIEYESYGVKQDSQQEQTESYYSYSILGTPTSPSELTQSGYKKVGNDTWTYKMTDIIDGYIWLENNIIISEGFVFHDINPALTHDVVADMVVDLFENGNIRKINKCTNGNDSSICSEIQKKMGNLISFPITIFKTDLSNIQCYLTQSYVFSNNKENQFFYVCALGR